MTRRTMIALGVLVVAGCQSQACTVVDCQSAVAVLLNGIEFPSGIEPATAHICVDDTCKDFALAVAASGPGAYVGAPEAGGKVTVAVEIRDAKGALLDKLKLDNVVLTKSQPNGPKCEPTCFSGNVDFDPSSRSLVGRAQPGVQG